MTDFLTVLECTEVHRAAKRYTDLAQKPDAYDCGFLYAPNEVPVASLDDIAEQLELLRTMPRCHIIRGKLKPEWPAGLVARRKRDHGDTLGAPFEEAEHWYFSIDADKSTTPFDADDRAGCVEAWRATLPAGLREAALVFQFSASQHLSETVRGHATFWLDEPLGGATLKLWAERNDFDSTVYGAVSVLYTADPLFAEGLADPLHPRELVRLPGGVASLDLTEAERCAVAGEAANRVGTVQLGEVGDPSPEPDAVKARDRVAKQLAAAFAAPDGTGRRWKLCGAVGGAFAKLGVPPEECCAVLDALRADDVADHDFHAGLNWALGAYGLEDVRKALGVKEIAAHTSGTTAERFESELARLAEATAPVVQVATTEASPVERATALAVFGAVESFEKMPEPPAYICAGLALAAGKISLCSGYAGTGKGPWIGYVLLCIAAGLPIGPFAVKRTPAALIDFETGPIAITRLQRLANALGLDLRALLAEGWFHFVTGTPPLSDEMIGAARHLARSGVGAIGLDSYTSAVGGDQNSPEFAGPAWLLGAVSNETGALVLANAHEKKKQDNKRGGSNLEMLSGTNTLAAACQTVMSIVRPDDDLKTVVEVRCARAPEEGFDPFQVRWDDVSTVAGKEFLRGGLADSKWGLRPTFIGQRAPTQLEQRANAKAAEKQARLSVLQEDILRLLGGGQCLPADQIRTMLSVGTDRARDAIGALREEGVIVLGSTPAAGGKLVGGWMLAPRSPRSAEALAKHQGAGFLAGGPLKKK